MAMNLPDPVCVVDNLITQGVNLLVSRPKVGKSWADMEASLAVASESGTVLGGKDVLHGAVLLLALEDNPRRLRERYRKLLGTGKIPDRLTIWTQSKRLGDGVLDDIAQWIEGATGPRLVVIDTFARIRDLDHGGGNPYLRDYADMGRIKAIADRYEVAFWVNHHERKMPADDWLDGVSGTAGLSAAADNILLLRRPRHDCDGSLHVTGRDVREAELGIRFDFDACRWSLTGGPPVVKLSRKRLEVLNLMANMGKPLTPKEIADLNEWDENTTKVLCHRMRKADQLKSNGNGAYVIPMPDR
jgi:hypothetical protein